MTILTAKETVLTARIKAALTRTDVAFTPDLPEPKEDETYLGFLPNPLRHLWLCIEELRYESTCGILETERNMTPEELIIESENFFDELLLIEFFTLEQMVTLHVRSNWQVVSKPRHGIS